MALNYDVRTANRIVCHCHRKWRELETLAMKLPRLNCHLSKQFVAGDALLLSEVAISLLSWEISSWIIKSFISGLLFIQTMRSSWSMLHNYRGVFILNLKSKTRSDAKEIKCKLFQNRFTINWKYKLLLAIHIDPTYINDLYIWLN